MEELLTERLIEIICDNTDVDPSEISEEKNLIEDLGIDSLDILDIVYEIDQSLGIQIPLEDWIADIDEDATLISRFKFANLVGYISSAS